MASWTTYKGLTIPDASSGDAGENLTDNLKLLADNFDALDAGDITTGTLAVARGGTGTGTAFTAGAIVFAGASGVYSQDSSRLVWDNTNKRLGVGVSAPAYPIDQRISTNSLDFGVNLENGCSSASSSTKAGLRATTTAQPSGNTSAAFCAIWASCQSAPAGSTNFTGSIRGMTYEAIHYGSGTVDTLMGEWAGAYQYTGSGTVTNRIGCYIGLLGQASTTTTNTYGLRIYLSESGTVSNHYGFYSPASNAAQDWGVYTLNARNYFAGRLGIGDDSPDASLDITSLTSSLVGLIVQGATSQTANLQELRNSGGSVLIQFDASGGAVFNEQGNDADFRVEGDTNANLLFADASADKIGIGTNGPTAMLDVNSNTIRVRTAKTPSSASDTGNQGDIAWDSSYVYVCVATNTWKRSSLSSW